MRLSEIPWDRLAAFPDLTIDWRADIGLVDVVDANRCRFAFRYALGIALLPLFDDLICDDWIQLLPNWQIKDVPLYVIYYKNRGTVATVRSFVAFLLERVQKV
ncbi:hypothetical protein [Moraxella sp. VT-16-12]|uniref:hypothetical protein n=1 Tax=Moraxella sp. VT-16-12 TaxID=2014877 RepID=UPI00117E30DF|nr:hypothetical protein [Moraxella sp. VT-16-12]TWV84625.1 hypothetical protein CEW93_000095 [Moraxella sp. VT-16-12]